MQRLSASTYWRPAWRPLLPVESCGRWASSASGRNYFLQNCVLWDMENSSDKRVFCRFLVTWTDCLSNTCQKNTLTHFCTQLTELELTGLVWNTPTWFSWRTFLDSATDTIWNLAASIVSYIAPCPGHELMNSWWLWKTQTGALSTLKGIGF